MTKEKQNLDFSIKKLLIKRIPFFVIIFLLSYFAFNFFELINDPDYVLFAFAPIFHLVYYLVLIWCFNKKRTVFYFLLYFLPLSIISLFAKVENFSSNNGCILCIPMWSLSLLILLIIAVISLIDYEKRRRKLRIQGKEISSSKSQKILPKFNFILINIILVYWVFSILYNIYFAVLDVFTFKNTSMTDYFITLLFIVVIWLVLFKVYKIVKNNKEIPKILKIIGIFIFNIFLIIILFFAITISETKYTFSKEYHRYMTIRSVVSNDLSACQKHIVDFQDRLQNVYCDYMMAVYSNDIDFCYNIPYKEYKIRETWIGKNQKRRISGINEHVTCFARMNLNSNNDEICQLLEDDKDRQYCIELSHQIEE